MSIPSGRPFNYPFDRIKPIDPQNNFAILPHPIQQKKPSKAHGSSICRGARCGSRRYATSLGKGEFNEESPVPYHSRWFWRCCGLNFRFMFVLAPRFRSGFLGRALLLRWVSVSHTVARCASGDTDVIVRVTPHSINLTIAARV